MSNQEWGVTERGFHRPTYVELLDAIEYKARELFGSKANLTVRSPLGIFLRIFAWMLNILFSLMEDVYNSRFVDTAVGTSLYNLGKAIGLSPASRAKGVRLRRVHRRRRYSYPRGLPGPHRGRIAVCSPGRRPHRRYRESHVAGPGR